MSKKPYPTQPIHWVDVVDPERRLPALLFDTPEQYVDAVRILNATNEVSTMKEFEPLPMQIAFMLMLRTCGAVPVQADRGEVWKQVVKPLWDEKLIVAYDRLQMLIQLTPLGLHVLSRNMQEYRRPGSPVWYDGMTDDELGEVHDWLTEKLERVCHG